ncbi:MAG: hypothetical protein EXR69_14545 [Myxococcales bacterium]|nr:hypothetical protein [Myxococcales bacterium]
MEEWTLVLTDVVESTALTARLGDVAMASLWRAHDRIVRDLVAHHGGREADRTDGFLLLFADTDGALAFAVGLHLGLAELSQSRTQSFCARVGVHRGPVILMEVSAEDRARGAKPFEVEGLAKPLAARVCGLAVGGQTLLTQAAVDSLPAGSVHRLEPCGTWQMKGVPEPVTLHALSTGDSTAPLGHDKAVRVALRDGAWVPVDSLPCNVSSERDSFVGRVPEVAAIGARLRESRLVTLLGLGGMGKTRLAVRYASRHRADHPGGVWFCDLVEARDANGIAAAVARALDIQIGSQDVLSQLGHALAARGDLLLVLDNFEQVAREAEGTVGLWLSMAPCARFLVTSRQALGIRGEAVYTVSPLPAADAIDLFLGRADAVRPDFVPTAAARDDIARLVRLLDHLPLAIELAATRVSTWSPRQILERMTDRFRVLAGTGARRGRQSTLRGVLDWSWELLSADERQALAQVSVFAGGFTLDAAEAVLSLTDLWAADALHSLVQKSLVRRVDGDRMDLLVSVHAYAAERLDESGGRIAAERRHADYFALLGEDAALDACRVHSGADRLASLSREYANLHAACLRGVARADESVAVRAAAAAHLVVSMLGRHPIAEVLLLWQAVDAIGVVDPVRRAVLLHGRVLGLWEAGRISEAAALSAKAVAAARRGGDVRRLVRGLQAAANVSFHAGQLDVAAAAIAEALALCPHDAGWGVERGNLMNNQALVHWERGEPAVAIALLRETFPIHTGAGNLRSLGIAQTNLGFCLAATGERAEAGLLQLAALENFLAVQDGVREGTPLVNLAELSLAAGDLDAAQRWAARAWDVYSDSGRGRYVAVTEVIGGRIEAARGRTDEAAPCFERGVRGLRACGATADLIEALAYQAFALAAVAPALATASLEEGDALVATLGLGPEAPVCRLLEDARRALT